LVGEVGFDSTFSAAFEDVVVDVSALTDDSENNLVTDYHQTQTPHENKPMHPSNRMYYSISVQIESD